MHTTMHRMQTAMRMRASAGGSPKLLYVRNRQALAGCYRAMAPAHQRHLQQRALVLSRVARTGSDSPRYSQTSDAGQQQGRPSNTELEILQVTDDLRLLEAERDEALKTAEASAKTSVRLEEMFRLLEKLALEKVQDGDEAAAREVLQEKAAINEVLVKSNSRAQLNYTLAMKLAEKIGAKQALLVKLLQLQGGNKQPSISSKPQQAQAAATSSDSYSSNSSSSSSSSRGAPAAPTPSPTYSYDSSSRISRSDSDYSSTYGGMGSSTSSSKRNSSGSSSGSSSSSTTSGFGGSGSYAWSAYGEAIGSRARKSAAESIEEARERLRKQALESVHTARSRIQQNAKESIAEARARIEREDAAALARVRQLVARYRAGEYVPDEQIEWAFQQLERRAWR